MAFDHLLEALDSLTRKRQKLKQGDDMIIRIAKGAGLIAGQFPELINKYSSIKKIAKEERKKLEEQKRALRQELERQELEEERLREHLEETADGVKISDTPVAVTLKPGVLIGKRYALKKFLGSGGFSEVWQAKDTYPPGYGLSDPTSLYVVLKLIVENDEKDYDEALATIEREFEIKKLLSHKNIIQVGQLSLDTRPAFLVLGADDGAENLWDYQIQDETVIFKLEVIRQFINAMHYIHENGVTHGDIKPGNILVSKVPISKEMESLISSGYYCRDTMITDGHAQVLVKVSDFGLAQATTEGRLSVLNSLLIKDTDSNIVGTPDYAAPEVKEGRVPDRASDVYSVGLTLFEIFTGRLPYLGEMNLSKPLKKEGVPKSLISCIIKSIRLDSNERVDMAKFHSIMHAGSMRKILKDAYKQEEIEHVPETEQSSEILDIQRDITDNIGTCNYSWPEHHEKLQSKPARRTE